MPKYDERYDYLDVDALFNSKRLVRNYVDCLISAQRCTPEGKQLKSKLKKLLLKPKTQIYELIYPFFWHTTNFHCVSVYEIQK